MYIWPPNARHTNECRRRQVGLLLPEDVEGISLTMLDDDVVVVAVDHQLARAIELRKVGAVNRKAASPETFYQFLKPRAEYGRDCGADGANAT